MNVPAGTPGFVGYHIGPSSGLFGGNTIYNRFTIDGEKLIVCAHGMRYVDFVALHKIFTEGGWGYDHAEVTATIHEHTHFYLNGERVTEEKMRSVFSSGESFNAKRNTIGQGVG